MTVSSFLSFQDYVRSTVRGCYPLCMYVPRCFLFESTRLSFLPLEHRIDHVHTSLFLEVNRTVRDYCFRNDILGRGGVVDLPTLAERSSRSRKPYNTPRGR